MTPAEAIARGQSIAAGESDPVDVAVQIMQRVSEDEAIRLHMSADALRGAAAHHARIVNCLVFAAESFDEIARPVSRIRALAGRIAGYLSHRSAGDVVVALCCASMGAAEFTNGRTGWAALLAAVACLNLVCAWISYRRAKGSP